MFRLVTCLLSAALASMKTRHDLVLEVVALSPPADDSGLCGHDHTCQLLDDARPNEAGRRRGMVPAAFLWRPASDHLLAMDRRRSLTILRFENSTTALL